MNTALTLTGFLLSGLCGCMAGVTGLLLLSLLSASGSESKRERRPTP